MARIIVLLASYNGVQWIEEQIESILAQQGVDVDLVVGDDVSKDDTCARIAARWAHDPRVRVIVWPESSGSAGANFLRLIRCVDVSQADAIAFADQDDIWWPHKLANGAAALIAAHASGYSAAVQARWDDGRTALLQQSPNKRGADFLFEGAGQGCTFVLDRRFFERIQSFLNSPEGQSVEMHFHDWLVYLLSRAWDEPWVFDPCACMTYRQHASNEIGARSGSGFLRRLSLIREGWYADQIAKACAAYVTAGGADTNVLHLITDLGQGHMRGRLASMRLALHLLRDGRRRVFDRAVLFVAALQRWI